MTQVEQVALWIGLLSGVVSITLSVVAITFTYVVNKRSEKVSDETIRALQSIESQVDRSADDTKELIKAAWDKLLGTFDTQPATTGKDVNAKDVAAGVVSELRSGIGELIQSSPGTQNPKELSERVAALEELLKDTQATLEAVLRGKHTALRPSSNSLDRMIKTLHRLSPRARGLAKAIRNRHLTKEQYQKLMETPLGLDLRALRRAGIIVPVTGTERGQGEVPAYYFPGGIIVTALKFLADWNEPISDELSKTLESVGYTAHRESVN